jgi:Lipoate-protein ligase B
VLPDEAMNAGTDAAVEWAVSDELVDYAEAVAIMEERAAAIAARKASELVWLLEHPPLYTAGTSTRWEDLIDPQRFPVYRAGRGGQLTYHGPGQRVVYVMLDIRRRVGDVRAFVHALEDWGYRDAAVVRRTRRDPARSRRGLGAASRTWAGG